MNKTYRDFVSSIRSMFKMISSDNVITDRVILSELQTVNILLCTQQLQKRNGWNSPNLFTILNCITMEAIPNYDCCNTNTNCMISRSTIKLPKIVDVNNNLVVQGVWSVDKRTKFKEIGTFDRYTDYLKLYPLKGTSEKFFWIEDDYLFTNDSLVEVVSAGIFCAEIIDPRNYTCNAAPECPINPLDLDMKTLPKLENDIKKIVRDIILRDYKNSIQDNSENDLDESK